MIKLYNINAKLAAAMVAGVATLGFSTGAMAAAGDSGTEYSWESSTDLTSTYSCSHAVYGTSGTYWAESAVSTGTLYGTDSRSTYDSSCTSNNTANAAGSVITAVAALRAASVQTAGLITARIANARAAANSGKSVAMTGSFDEGNIGISAGNGDNPNGVWVQGAYVKVDNTDPSAKFDGKVWTGMAGYDRRLGDKFLAGVALGYEKQDYSTKFNNGTLDGKGYLVAPYASVQLGKIVSVDASAGYAHINYTSRRTEAAGPGSFDAKYSARRYFGSLDVNADYSIDKINLGATAGVLSTSERKQSYTEGNGTTSVNVAAATTNLTQGSLGMRAGYDLGKVEPYLKASIDHDFSKSSAPSVASTQTAIVTDSTAFTVGGGLNLRLSDAISGVVEAYTVLGREKYSETGGTARIRVEF